MSTIIITELIVELSDLAYRW